MKKKLVASLLALTLVLAYGCGKKDTASSDVTSSSTTTSGISSNQDQNNGDITTISDISNWSHPVKTVLLNANVKINKVEILNNNTYPVFYVTFPSGVDTQTKAYFENLIKDAAKANGYWSYKLIDQHNNITIEVNCDTKHTSIEEVIYNGDKSFFADITAANTAVNTNPQNNTTPNDPSGANTAPSTAAPNNGTTINTNINTGNAAQADLITYLKDNVPELSNLTKSLASAGGGTKLIIYIESQPRPTATNVYQKNYYTIYVGESHPNYSVNICRFLIEKDSKQILFWDVVNNQRLTLQQWRSSGKGF